MDIASLGLALDTSGLKRGDDALRASQQGANKTADAFDDLGARGSKSFSEVGRSSDQASRQLDGLRRSSALVTDQLTAMTRGIGLVGVGLGLREMVQAADAASNLASRLAVVSTSAEQAAATQAKLFEVAQRTRTSWDGLAQTYSYLAKAGQELGVGQDKILRVTENISKAITISGGSAESAKAALVQFSQGLASGTLRGEELNSVLEQTPRLAQAIADGMGVSIGELRKLGAEGKLIPTQLIDAIDKAGKQLESEFSRIPLTVEQAFTQLRNAFQKQMGDVNEATGVFRTFADGLSFVAKNLDYFAVAAQGLIAVKIAGWAIDGAAGLGMKADAALVSAAATRQETLANLAFAESEVAATSARAAELAATEAAIVAARADQAARLASANANLRAAEAAIAAATANGVYSGSLRVIRLAEAEAAAAMGARSAAMAELAILGQQQVRVNAEIAASTVLVERAQQGLNVAQTAGAAGASLASRALGLLGGPVGLLVTGLGLAVSAWEIYELTQKRSTDSGASAAGKQVSVSNQATAQIIADLNAQIQKYKERDAARDGGAASSDTGRLAEQKQRLADLKAKNTKITPAQLAANPYNPDLLQEAQLENAITELEKRMRGERVRVLQEQGSAMDRELKGINANYEKYVDIQKGLLAEGAINLDEYVKRVKVAYDKWGGVKKPKAASDKQFQNELGGELQGLKEQADLRQKQLKGELATEERLRNEGFTNQEEFLARSFAAKDAALKKDLEQAKQAAEVASGRKSLREQETYRGRVKEIQQDIQNNNAEYLRAVSAHQKTIDDIMAAAAAKATAFSVDRQRQISRDLAAFGMSDNARELNANMTRVEDAYRPIRDQAIKELSRQGLREGDTKFDETMTKLDTLRAADLDKERKYQADKIALQGEWSLGATRALENYRDSAANVFQQTESLVTKAFSGMEDALVNFAMTGKLNFSDFAKSVISDLIRIQARAAVSGLAQMGVSLVGSLFSGVGAGAPDAAGGAWSGFNLGGAGYSPTVDTSGASGIFATRAGGGDVQAGLSYLVGENGPEPFIPDRPGKILPTSAFAQQGAQQAPSLTIENHNTYNIDSRTDRADVIAAIQQSQQKTKADILDSINRGGAFSPKR